MRERPLVVHIVHRLDVGGLENGLVNLVNATGHQLRHAIICMTTAGRFKSRLDSPGVEVVELGKRPGKDLRAYARLWRELRRLEPLVVHTRNFGTLDCQMVAMMARAPCRVHGEHGWDTGDIDGTCRKRRLLRRLSPLLVHRYVAVSGHLRQWLVDDVGLPRERVVCIINGVDTVRFRPRAHRAGADSATHPFRFLYVGRLDPVKGPDVLLEAFARLCSHSAKPAVLTVVGDGSMSHDLVRRVRELGLDEQIRLVGARDDVPAAMAEADAFVLPSRNEGISNTVLEAMACGLPVIATAVGGTPEIVAHGESGQLVPPEDPGALAAAMDLYLERRDLAALHGSNGRARTASEFSLDAMVSAYLDLYGEVMKSKSGASCAG